eukprot:3160002-Pyramimonas_sp.AAC.1
MTRCVAADAGVVRPPFQGSALWAGPPLPGPITTSWVFRGPARSPRPNEHLALLAERLAQVVRGAPGARAARMSAQA